MSTASPQAWVGPDPWRAVSDAVLRGLNHALSNRITSLSVVSALVEPSVPPGPELARTIAAEVARMEGVLRLLRLLPADQAGSGAEPVRVADALADALALHAHHAGLSDCVCTVDGDVSALLPVLAPPVALTHALVLLLGATAVHARARSAPAVLHVGGDEQAVRLTGELGGESAERGAGGRGDLAPDAVGDALRRMLGDTGARVAVEVSLGTPRVELALPTLTARR